MNDQIRRSLSRGHLIDITTTGRKSHEPRRIEIVFHNIEGRLIISGLPSTRKRAWVANLEADPHLTIHLKGGPVQADLPATARIITDDADRRAIAAWIVANAWRNQDLEKMTAWSPMIEVTIADLAA